MQKKFQQREGLKFFWSFWYRSEYVFTVTFVGQIKVKKHDLQIPTVEVSTTVKQVLTSSCKLQFCLRDRWFELYLTSHGYFL